MTTYPPDQFGYAPDPAMVEKFKREVDDRADQIDPSSEHHWGTLTLGWAVAQGMNVDPELSDPQNNAHNFARYIRYHTDLG